MYHTEETVDIKQASEYCHRNPETVRRWVWNGKLPAQKVGNQLFIRKKDLVRFCRETAIAYHAQPEADAASLETIRQTGTEIHNRTGRSFNAAEEIETLREDRDREMNSTSYGPDFLERARSVREAIHARSGRVFDVEKMIRELREERDGRAE